MLVALVRSRGAKPSNQAGFTVLELMVATTIFAIVLLVLTVGVLSFSRDYFSSVTRSDTQTVARAISDDISKTLQFSGGSPTIGSSGKTASWCIDNVQYLYATGYEVSDAANLAKHQSKYGLIKRVSTSGCGTVSDLTGAYVFNGATDKELLGKNMRISALNIQKVNDAYNVHVRVAYGDDDLLGVTATTSAWDTISCKSNTGSQFCAVSDLATTVQQRITR